MSDSEYSNIIGERCSFVYDLDKDTFDDDMI